MSFDPTRLLKQMQEQLQRTQAEFHNIRVEGSAGGGMVRVVANCDNQILDIQIEEEVINSDDREMLQDLIVAAVNQALHNANQRRQEELRKLLGPLAGNLPDDFSFPGM